MRSFQPSSTTFIKTTSQRPSVFVPLSPVHVRFLYQRTTRLSFYITSTSGELSLPEELPILRTRARYSCRTQSPAADDKSRTTHGSVTSVARPFGFCGSLRNRDVDLKIPGEERGRQSVFICCTEHKRICADSQALFFLPSLMVCFQESIDRDIFYVSGK